MNKFFFGTDGVRGVYGQWPINEKSFFVLGASVSSLMLRKKNDVIVIAADCRPSSESLLRSFIAGVRSSRPESNIVYIGVMHTASLFFAMEHFDASVGAMITASHNEESYNGIKFFDSNRMKFAYDVEKKVEENYFFNLANEDIDINLNRKNFEQLGDFKITDFIDIYVKKVLSFFNFCNLNKFILVCDCGGGTVYEILHKAFVQSLRLEVIFINYGGNDGKFSKDISKTILDAKADFGFKFDCDADRIILFDEKGEQVEGEYLMAVIAEFYLSKGRNDFVCNDLTSLSFDDYLANKKINVLRSDVGEKSLLNKIIQNNSLLGAENSGHLIFFNLCKTSDAVLSALILLQIINVNNASVAMLFSKIFDIMPRILLSVDVFNKGLISSESFIKSLEEKKNQSKSIKRIVIRPSGTEPVIRVLVEGQDFAEVKRVALLAQEAIKEYDSKCETCNKG